MPSARPECASDTTSVNQKGSGAAEAPSISWRIRTTATGDVDWDWSYGPPALRSLAPVRRPKADSMSRHAPVQMSCQTTGSTLILESGLEYELARELDRDRSVVWIVAQPAMITFADGSRHVPDLACEHADGRVVVWDARPTERRDEKFLRTAKLTEQACAEVSWEYALYDTAHDARRLNVLWLASFRHEPQWPHHAAHMQLATTCANDVTVGELMELDDGDGHTIALMWHLLWTGELVVDLDERITAGTVVRYRGDAR